MGSCTSKAKDDNDDWRKNPPPGIDPPREKTPEEIAEQEAKRKAAVEAYQKRVNQAYWADSIEKDLSKPDFPVKR